MPEPSRRFSRILVFLLLFSTLKVPILKAATAEKWIKKDKSIQCLGKNGKIIREFQWMKPSWEFGDEVPDHFRSRTYAVGGDGKEAVVSEYFNPEWKNLPDDSLYPSLYKFGGSTVTFYLECKPVKKIFLPELEMGDLAVIPRSGLIASFAVPNLEGQDLGPNYPDPKNIPSFTGLWSKEGNLIWRYPGAISASILRIFHGGKYGRLESIWIDFARGKIHVHSKLGTGGSSQITPEGKIIITHRVGWLNPDGTRITEDAMWKMSREEQLKLEEIVEIEHEFQF
jgi:hypothetical protein